MSIPLSSLSDKLNTNVLGDDIFLISNANSSQDNKITRDELSQSFDSFTAQNVSGFTIFESAGAFGLSVSGANGFVGINDRTPSVSLDIVDNSASTNGLGQIRISGASARKIGISITDPSVYYQFSKKPNDTKLYLESSINGGSTFTNLMAVDQSGNFAIHGTTGGLTNKFLISGEFVQFQNSGNALIFDPYTGEIKTSATDEILLLNYNNIADINIGKNGVFVKNNISTPYVGIGHSSPNAVLHASGVGQVAKLQSSSTTVSQCFKHSTSDAFIGLNSNKFYFGPSNGLSSYNIVYNMAGDGTFGLGTANPVYKLDLLSTGPTEYTVAHFETTGAKICEVVIGSNKVLGGADTGPRNSFLTFSRYDGTTDIDKWSIGNIKTDTTFGGNDDFVFITNGYFGASPDVVAKLSTAGNLDIDGSYATASSYCKGQYIQVYTTSLAGASHIYIDPFGTNASSASNNSNIVGNAPFGVAMYAGSLQRIRFSVTATTAISNVIFQFYAITPAAAASSTTNNIGNTTDTANVIYTNTIPSLVAGTTTLVIPTSHSFAAGQLLQFRLFTSGPAPLNAVVQMTSSFRYIIV